MVFLAELRGAEIAYAERTFRSHRHRLVARLDRAYRTPAGVQLVELKTRPRDAGVHVRRDRAVDTTDCPSGRDRRDGLAMRRGSSYRTPKRLAQAEQGPPVGAVRDCCDARALCGCRARQGEQVSPGADAFAVRPLRAQGRGAEPRIRTVPESPGGRRPDQTAPATALQGDASTDQQHDRSHIGWPAVPSRRQQQATAGPTTNPGTVVASRNLSQPRATCWKPDRPVIGDGDARISTRGAQPAAVSNEVRCRLVACQRRTAASAFSGQQHQLSSGAAPNSRPRPGWSDRAAADPGCWDRNRTAGHPTCLQRIRR